MLGLVADYARDEVTSADVLLVPGGIGTRPLVDDEPTLEWIRALDAGERRGRRRCAPARCCSARPGLLAGQGGHDALARARPARALRRDAGVGTRRRAGQGHHRGRRVVGHRHGAARSRPASPATTSRRRSSSASSTTRSPPSTAAPSPRPPRTSWSSPSPASPSPTNPAKDCEPASRTPPHIAWYRDAGSRVLLVGDDDWRSRGRRGLG